MAGDPLPEAEDLLGYSFSDSELLRKALTHSSFMEESGTGKDYERLEFLGDAVLELLTREYLVQRFPDEQEGVLTRRKIRIVQKQNLARHGIRLGLDRLAMVGRSFVPSPGARRSIAADILESVIGAIYTDSGLEPVREFVRREIFERSPERDPRPDPRSRLQEHCQAAGLELPEYRTTERSGPDHSPVFTVTVSIDGKEAGTGRGPTRKAAREEAAARALRNIERTV
ncbi:MAG: ribonuclease III [Candidatus Fermentibacteraceae bacterium]|nr:ribonuclease III [Candidatus Fermentibacteraceae bacterium]MBN2608992.1 ribonuclease III [Candidatus Fermentibacteraceae bacterium]